MKKVAFLLAFALALLLASCASTPVSPPMNKTDVPIVSDKPMSVHPEWTTKTFVENSLGRSLVVTGSVHAVWKDLLSQAALKATGFPQEAWVKAHATAPEKPDWQDLDQAWWLVPFSLAEQANSLVPQDPTLALEAAADTALAQGSPLSAIDGYLEAAARSVDASPASPAGRFPVLLSKALEVVSHLVLRPLPGIFETKTGTAFGQPFRVGVYYANGTIEIPVASAPVRFSAKLKKNGRLAVSGQTRLTDTLGIASYAFPTPDFSGQDDVVAVLDVNTWLEKLVSVPREYQERIGQIETIAAQHRTTIAYKIESLSKTIPVSLVFADYDEKGSILRRNDTQSSLIAGLAKSGYPVSANSAFNLALMKKDDATILLAWLSQGKKSGRAAFGTSTVTEVTSADKKITATVNGTLKVYDLETRKLVHQQKGGKTATANDRTTAFAQALQALAADFVSVLNDELP